MVTKKAVKESPKVVKKVATKVVKELPKKKVAAPKAKSKAITENVGKYLVGISNSKMGLSYIPTGEGLNVFSGKIVSEDNVKYVLDKNCEVGKKEGYSECIFLAETKKDADVVVKKLIKFVNEYVQKLDELYHEYFSEFTLYLALDGEIEAGLISIAEHR